MITYESNEKLYKKLSEELSEYRQWLISQPAEEILHHAYEYSVKQDIVMYAVSADLDEESVSLLVTSLCALDDIYDALNKIDAFRVSDIGEAIIDAAQRLEISFDIERDDR